jgi:hypothetical protein
LAQVCKRQTPNKNNTVETQEKEGEIETIANENES